MRVFVSHTSDFGDKTDSSGGYVRAALDAISRAGFVASEMSFFPAASLSPAELSEEMATRADIYVGLIGWNYGSPVRESPGISYTQLEFRKAGEAGVPRLVFMLAGDGNEDRDKRQLRFRQEILDSGITVQTFKDAVNLDNLVYQALIDGPTWDPALGSTYLRSVQASLSRRHLGGDVTASSGRDVRLSANWKDARSGEKRVEDVLATAMAAERLVLIGGPGSGKSHIARQAAVSVAREGLRQLSVSRSARDIEIPLYATVAAVIECLPGTASIWDALIKAALWEISESLPAIRIVKRLQQLLSRGKEKFFVVLDGLDEAGRTAPVPIKVLLADIANKSHRILLTSRPGAWHGQLEVEEQAEGGGILELNRLDYDALEGLIRGALKESDAEKLLEEIYRRPDLEDAARVPIFALLCCAVTAETEIPPTRHELYEIATNRILTGIWRKGHPDDPAPLKEARRLAQEAAWRLAVEDNDPETGLATWGEEVELDAPANMDPRTGSALEHLLPRGTISFDTLSDRRRFTHQTLREHLVACHLAKLPWSDAAEHIRPHLWFDPFWEQIIPSAIAQHKNKEDLINALVAGPDVTEQSCVVLARVAAESYRREWEQYPVAIRLIEISLDLLDLLGALPAARAQYVALGWPFPGRERLATSIEAGDSCRPDIIRLAGFSENERSKLSAAVQRRIVADRVISATGAIGSRTDLAVALSELATPEDLAATREKLHEIYKDLKENNLHRAFEALAAAAHLSAQGQNLTDLTEEGLAALEGATGCSLVEQVAMMLNHFAPDAQQRVRLAKVLVQCPREVSTRYDLRRIWEVCERITLGRDEYVRFVTSFLTIGMIYSGKHKSEVEDEIEKVLSILSQEMVDNVLINILPKLAQLELKNDRLIRDLAAKCSVDARIRAARWLLKHGENFQWRFFGLKAVIADAPKEDHYAAVERLIRHMDEEAKRYRSGFFLHFLVPSPEQRNRLVEQFTAQLERCEDYKKANPVAAVIAYLKPIETQRARVLEWLRRRLSKSNEDSLGYWIESIARMHNDGVLDRRDREAVIDRLAADDFDPSALEYYTLAEFEKHGGFDSDQLSRLFDELLPSEQGTAANASGVCRRLHWAASMAQGRHEESERIAHLVEICVRSLADTASDQGYDLQLGSDLGDLMRDLTLLEAHARTRRKLAADTYRLMFRYWENRRFVHAWRDLDPQPSVLLRLVNAFLKSLSSDKLSGFARMEQAKIVRFLLPYRKDDSIAVTIADVATMEQEDWYAAMLLRLGLEFASPAGRDCLINALAENLRARDLDGKKRILEELDQSDLTSEEVQLLLNAVAEGPDGAPPALELAKMFLAFQLDEAWRARLADAVVEQAATEELSLYEVRNVLLELPITAKHASRLANASWKLRTFVYRSVRHSLPFNAWLQFVTGRT